MTAPFMLIYLTRELHRRIGQAFLVALGLAVGIATVIAVTSASRGIGAAQTRVLHVLYGIGTDLAVTKPRPVSARLAGSSPAESDSLTVGSQSPFSSATVEAVARMRAVRDACGALMLTDIKRSSAGFPDTLAVEGIETDHLRLGPFASGTIIAGHTLATADANATVAVVDSAYAEANHLHVGSAMTIAAQRFSVIGLLQQSASAAGADAYIPLRQAQALTSYGTLSNLNGRVNIIYATARSASAITALKAKIVAALPGATVATAADLAKTVTGSLASAARLIDELSAWVALAALTAAAAVASMLTLGAVNRRTREFGTLRALGWSRRRIVAQVLNETLVISVVGAAIGVGVGIAALLIIDAAAPTLSATLGSGQETAKTLTVHFAAHTTASRIALASLLALAGGLIAGLAGAWRATHLQPADAFTRLG